MSRRLINEVDAHILSGLATFYLPNTMQNKFGDGEDAAYIYDESGNGFNMSSAEGGTNNPPSMVHNAANGDAAFLFNAANSEELRGDCSIAAINYLFAVVKATNAGNWNAATIGMFGGLAGVDAGLIGTAGTQEFKGPGEDTTEYINGVVGDTVANTDEWNLLFIEYATPRPFTGITVGRFQGTTGFFDGQMAQFGAGFGVNTTAQRDAFFASTIAKYNITG